MFRSVLKWFSRDSGCPSLSVQGKMLFQGLLITLENDRGSYRHGYDKHGRPWRVFMHIPYGFIDATEGADGEHVDVYVGTAADSRRVFIVHQNDPDTGRYDEDKVLLGFRTSAAAKAAYLRQYNRPEYFGSMHGVDMAIFKMMLRDKKGLKLKKGLKSMRPDVPVMKALVFPEESLIKSNSGIWYLNLSDVTCRFYLSKGFNWLQKAYYSPQEIKARGMRWVTIRGAKVLIKPLGSGGYAVVGGAGGKLNHLKIDKLATEAEYAAQRKRMESEKREETAALTDDEKREAIAKERVRRDARRQARSEYYQKVQDVLGVSQEDLKGQITNEDMEEISEKARLMVETRAKKPEDYKKAVEEQVEKEVKKAVVEKVKNVEREAMDVLMNDYAPSDPNAQHTLKDLLDKDKAMEVLQARKDLKAQIKAIGKEAADVSTNLKVGDVTAGKVDAASIMQDIEDAREVEKNVEFYDMLNAQSSSIQSHIDEGSISAMNGLLGEIYGIGATFNADTVKNLGLEAVVRAVASKIQSDGEASAVKKALEKYASKEREKVVSDAMRESKKRFENAKDLRSMARGSEDAEAMLSMASANGHALKHITAGQRALGTAVGSLRAVAHMINALEDPPADVVQVDMGKDLFRARLKAKAAGLKKGEYSLRTKAEGRSKRLVMEIPKESISNFIQNNQNMREGESVINEIKRYEKNDGYKPEGMKDSIKLKPAQEAGLRFFKEQDKVLLDFEAGLGKTAVGYAAAMEMINNKGAKKVLIVTPAKLRKQMYEERKTFLDENNQDSIRYAGSGATRKSRIAKYEKDGVMIIGHDQLRTDYQAIKDAGYDGIIVDEIHEMTAGGGASGRFKGLRALQDIPLKIGMSGTNIKNKKKELYRKIAWIDPQNTLGTMSDFEKRYKGLNQGTGIFSNSANDAFRKEVGQWVYTQKNKLDVQNFQERVKVDLSPEERRAYAESDKKYQTEKGEKRLGAAARRDVRAYDLIHKSPGSKIKETVNILKNNHPGEKAVIHMTRLEAVRDVKKSLEAEFGAGSVGVIQGSSSDAEVSKVKASFNDPEGKVKFIVGTSSLESGHNLQGGGTVNIHFDIPQTDSARRQREARTFRQGQTRDTKSYMLVANTPQEMRNEDLLNMKEKESAILGNPRAVEAMDESGLAGMYHKYKREELSGKEVA